MLTPMDKKALKREYKETARPMGVYQIRNTTNGKVLIGTSTDLPSILNRRRVELRVGSHRNRELQSDWNALGAEAFEIGILDTLPPSEQPGYDPADDLAALEGLWLEKLRPYGERGYHAAPKTA
jgi:hypothetical protein